MRSRRATDHTAAIRTALFSFTLFLSAALMFMMQPMIGKMMLPLVGGAPSGWLVALAFFQITLLAGYGCAHILSRFPPVRHMAAVCAALVLGIVLLPFSLGMGTDNATPNTGEVFFMLALHVSLPFFALSLVSSSLQRLYSAASPNADPYFLYAASNFGSFCGLFAYPFWLERNFGLAAQSHDWFGVYVLLILLCIVCIAVTAWRIKTTVKTKKVLAIKWAQRRRWMFLTFIPASMMLGITSYITLETGSVPLFWIVPLGLYLLTFVIAFSQHQFISRDILAQLQPILLATAVAIFVARPFTYGFGPHEGIITIAVFLSTALLCHMTLAAERPAAANLTEYYFWIACGGALGGIFNAFIIPLILPLPIEYLPVALLSCVVFTGYKKKYLRLNRSAVGLIAAAAIAGTAIWGIYGPNNLYHSNLQRVFSGLPTEFVGAAALLGLFIIAINLEFWEWLRREIRLLILGGFAVAFLLAVIAGLVFLDFQITAAVFDNSLLHKALIIAGFIAMVVSLYTLACWRPKVFACLVPLLGLLAYWTEAAPQMVDLQRNFFGVWRVYERSYVDSGLVMRILAHGPTVHGIQKIAPEIDDTPRAYYDPNGPLGDIFSIIKPQDVGAVGLGAGSLVCYEAPGRNFTVYEIDPSIFDIASRDFDYINHCGAPKMVIGDGRRALAAADDAQHDLIIIDAFTSDMIPIHFLTREAFETYFDRLGPNGVLALHISSRFYDLSQPISNIANALGLHGKYIYGQIPLVDKKNPKHGYSLFSYASNWVVISRSASALTPFAKLGWWDLPPPEGRLWTDDYSDVLSVVSIRSLWQGQ